MNESAHKDVFPGWLPLLGLTIVTVYIASALIAFKHWTTDVNHVVFVCGFYGVLLSVPLCLSVILIQLLLKGLTRGMPPSRWGFRFLVALAPPLLLLLLALRFAHIGPAELSQSFRSFFPFSPSSVKVLAFGYERTALGDGSYVLVFEIAEEDLHSLLNTNGYKLVDINSDPDHWRLDLCNSVVHRLTRKNVQILPNLKCYDNRTSTTESRVFYAPTNHQAIFLGFGRYK